MKKITKITLEYDAGMRTYRIARITNNVLVEGLTKKQQQQVLRVTDVITEYTANNLAENKRYEVTVVPAK